MENSEKKRSLGSGDCTDGSSTAKKPRRENEKSKSTNGKENTDAFDNEVWSDTEEWNSIAEAAENFVSKTRKESQCIQSNEQTEDKKPSISKIESVQKDTNVIASVFSHVDPEFIYEKIKDKRSDPNRVDIVTNQILENGLGETSASDSKVKAAESECQKSSSEETTGNDSKFKDYVLEVFGKLQDENPDIQISFSEISALLKKNSDKSDRINYVTWLITSGQYKKPASTDKCDIIKQTDTEKPVPSTSSADIFQDVKNILSKIPEASPDKVYSLLEENVDCENRVTKVINILKERGETCKKPLLEKSDSISDDPRCVRDPLYRDMRIIHKVFPDRDPNEIYAHLEAHHDKSNRLEIIIEQFMKPSSQEADKVDGSTASKDGQSSGNKGKQHVVKEEPILKIQTELEELQEMFPDCDPNYLFSELENRASDPDGTKRLVQEMIERKNYPKLKETMEKQKVVVKRRLSNMEFHFDDFMQRFPDALTYFYDLERQVNNNYKDHCFIYIQNKFPRFKVGFIREVLAKYGHHLAPAYKEFEEVSVELASRRRNSKKLRIQEREAPVPYPDDLDELFVNEKLFIEHETEIKDQIREKEEIRKMKIEEARKSNDLFECACCFDDECLFEDLMACNDGHLFCKECVRRSSEGIIGQGKAYFPCLGADCDHQFPLSVLQNVLTARNFSILLRRMQEEEIRQADIPDLVTCPFCSFATIMPNENDRVFKCLSPECLKESCRLCKEPNHIPLRCEEVEKQGETNMRTYIENKISEAMLRTCPRCKKRFVKEFGCNKMTCVCGETMCYVCRESGIDYDHFDGRNRCSVDTDMLALHQKEMEEAAKKAKEKYLEEHPEAKDVSLKYDPFSHIKDMQKKLNHGPGLFGMNYEEDVYDDEDDDYDDDENDGEEGGVYFYNY